MITIYINGEPLFVKEGSSLSAALLNAGTRILRATRFNSEPRAMFCGIGVCFDCVVTIDGVRNQRACMQLCREGMQVELS